VENEGSSGRERPPRRGLEWAALAALLAVAVGLTALELGAARREIEQAQRTRLEHQASIVDRMLSTRLAATAGALDLLRADLPEHRARPDGMARLGEQMKAMVASTAGIRTFLLVDARGVAVASNREELLGIDFHEGERYRAIRAAPDPKRLYLSPPFMTPLKNWALSLGRAVLDERGRFDGYLLAIIDPEYWQLLLDSTRYAPDMAVGMVHGGGKVIYRVPDPQGAVGMDLSARPDTSFSRHVASGRDMSTEVGPLPSNGKEALGVLRTVRPAQVGADGFLVAGFSRDPEVYLAPWRRAVRDRLAVLVVLGAAASAGLHLWQRRRLDRWRRAQARAAQQAQAAESQKLESIGRLAGGVAHDFNNLLTIILASGGEARAAARQGRPADPELLDEVLGAAGRAAELTRQLLAFARKQAIAPVTLDLNEQLRASQKLLRRVIGEEIQVVEQLQPGIWPVRCDPGLLGQVVLNLSVNARDAMPGGGTLTVSTANVTVPPGEAVPEAGVHPGDYVALRVADTGSGMPPEVTAHLFEPFFTTKAPGRGTGLGLSTVYGIVKQSGAHIGVQSAPGRGTAFEILFPRCEPAPPPAPDAEAADPGGHETVLVVEDEPGVRSAVAGTLRAAGYQVLEAADAAQALAQAGAAGRLDLLITDVVMPWMRGEEVARLVAQRHPGVPVIFMSGHPLREEGSPAPGPAGGDFLPKPFPPEALRARVRAALDRKAPA
jgi:signal transduction histidine kinase